MNEAFGGQINYTFGAEDTYRRTSDTETKRIHGFIEAWAL